MSDVFGFFSSRPLRHIAAALALSTGMSAVVSDASAQDTPLISGGVGFFSSTNGGNTTYLPVLSPLLAAPIGSHVLVESRANLIESFFVKGNGQPGYTSAPFLNLTFLQGDFLVSPHLTIVAGDFLTPFGTYNERLSPIWIGKFEDGPLIIPLGTMGTDSSVGGMVRGSAISNAKFYVDYAAYFSTTSTNLQFNSERSSGGRASVYFPQTGLEVGGSYGRLLQGTHQNYSGLHVWWQPIDSPFHLRSEYAHGEHSQGYWVETDYRLSHFGGPDSAVGRLEPIFRMQQTFRNSPDPTDGLPSADTRRADFGLDYYLPHELRINTSYARQLSSTGNRNVWETGLVYRFLFPTWKGK
ncbi:MAG TPA: hypothetical protein VHW46_18075 [Terracidiphilus sp.]|jgi:hypothetical protein|nr:hypothetical protein [Terracidiphilus sp.]